MVRWRDGSGADGHPEDASLHAWMKGELEGPVGAGISTHLSTCADCQGRVARMEPVLQGLEGFEAADLDDLSWRRISQAVKREIENPKRNSLPPLASFWGQRWVSAVAVTAAVVVLFVWGSPPLKLRSQKVEEPPGATLVSAERGYVVRLPSGVDLTLSADTQVRLGRSEAAPGLYLQLGEIDLLVPESVELPTGGFEVRSPAFRVSARSGRLRVGYWAREYFVEVQKGEAQLRPEGQTDAVTIVAGERRTVHLMSGPIASRVPTSEPTTTPVAAVAPTEAVAPGEAIPHAARPTSRTIETGPAEEREPEEETSVEVIPPPPDPLREKLLEANRAFYETRDAARAVVLAGEIAATDAPRPEVRLAYALLCEAHLALSQPERAVVACEAQLLREPDPENKREVHFKLGSILRTMLDRCPDAIRHYSETIVFGRVSLMDTEARLGRATCALETGDLGLAERDLDLLSTAPGLHAVRVSELINRMDSLRKSKKAEMDVRDE